MGQRLLPQTLIDLYAHSLAIEREAFKRFVELERLMRDAGVDHLADEFERIGREEQEQYDALSLGTAERQLPAIEDWEYAWHYLGREADIVRAPRNAREALQQSEALRNVMARLQPLWDLDGSIVKGYPSGL